MTMSKKAVPDDGQSSSGEPSKPQRLTHKEEFPDPVATLGFVRPPLIDAFDRAVVYLDASVLLGLYETAAHSLKEVEKVYAELIANHRLIVPVHALREFLRRQDEKVGSISAAIMNKASGLRSIPEPKGTLEMEIPALVHGLPSYEKLVNAVRAFSEAEEMLTPAIDDFNAKRSSVINSLRDLEGEFTSWVEDTDPVRESYASLFTADVVYDAGDSVLSISADAEHRRAHSISPLRSGEPGKDSNEYGDLLIWRSIVKHAQEALDGGPAHPAVFVTNDLNKGDWATRAGDELITRRDLVEEYRAATQGESFYVVTLGRLLELAGAGSEVVEAVEGLEPDEERILSLYFESGGMTLCTASQFCDIVHSNLNDLNARHEELQRARLALDKAIARAGQLEAAHDARDVITRDRHLGHGDGDLSGAIRAVSASKRDLHSALREVARHCHNAREKPTWWIVGVEGPGSPGPETQCIGLWDSIRDDQKTIENGVERVITFAEDLESKWLDGFALRLFVNNVIYPDWS